MSRRGPEARSAAGSAAGSAGRSNDVERLLRSGRAEGADSVWFPPGLADQRVDEAIGAASSAMAEAHRLLEPYRRQDAAEAVRLAYEAVHAARGQLAAARHRRAVVLKLASRPREDGGSPTEG